MLVLTIDTPARKYLTPTQSILVFTVYGWDGPPACIRPVFITVKLLGQLRYCFQYHYQKTFDPILSLRQPVRLLMGLASNTVEISDLGFWTDRGSSFEPCLPHPPYVPYVVHQHWMPLSGVDEYSQSCL